MHPQLSGRLRHVAYRNQDLDWLISQCGLNRQVQTPASATRCATQQTLMRGKGHQDMPKIMQTTSDTGRYQPILFDILRTLLPVTRDFFLPGKAI